MIEDTTLGEAIALAADIHQHQLYGDVPYIFHVLQVLKTVQEQGESIEVQIAAIFHDAIEDHPEQEARIVGFLADNDMRKVHTTLGYLTRHYQGQETYKEFIDRVTQDRDATVVKLADLQRNAAPKNRRSTKHIQLALNRYIPAMAKVTKALLKHERTEAKWAQLLDIEF